MQLSKSEEREATRSLERCYRPVLPTVINVTGHIPFKILLAVSLGYCIDKHAPRLCFSLYGVKPKLRRLMPEENRYRCEGEQVRHVPFNSSVLPNTQIAWRRKPNRTLPCLGKEQ